MGRNPSSGFQPSPVNLCPIRSRKFEVPATVTSTFLRRSPANLFPDHFRSVQVRHQRGGTSATQPPVPEMPMPLRQPSSLSFHPHHARVLKTFRQPRGFPSRNHLTLREISEGKSLQSLEQNAVMVARPSIVMQEVANLVQEVVDFVHPLSLHHAGVEAKS